MKISNIEVIQIETPRHYQTLPGFEDSFSGHLIVKVHVDDGPIGLGEASDSKAKDVASIASLERVVDLGHHLFATTSPATPTSTTAFLAR